MKLDSIELRRIELPLVSPFRAAHGTETARDVLLVKVTADGVEGWGECVALREPTYTAEYVDGAQCLIRTYLAPRLLAAEVLSAEAVGPMLAFVAGHPMAKAALEMAVLDAELRVAGTSLASHLGGVRDAVPAGVAIGLQPSIDEMLHTVDGFLADGYRRIKVKIEPGRDLEVVQAIQKHIGSGVALQVDANGAYVLDDLDAGKTAAGRLLALDELGLQLIEQPLAADDLVGHAELQRRMQTPLCLDESIVSLASASTALRLQACRVVNLKPGRVGGLLEARRIHDLCVAVGVPVWCGGMLETGLGRAANVALASLPGFTLPGDLSASDRYYATDITEPFVLDDSRLRVPTGPGLGVTPRPDVLATVTTTVEVLTR